MLIEEARKIAKENGLVIAHRADTWRLLRPVGSGILVLVGTSKTGDNFLKLVKRVTRKGEKK